MTLIYVDVIDVDVVDVDVVGISRSFPPRMKEMSRPKKSKNLNW
jgi:hypothetical protein